MHLDKLFNPKIIAVIGASDEPGSVGQALMDNLINSDYAGTVFPVNIKHDHVHSVRAYDSVLEIPDPVDLAIIATPASTVPQIVEECGQAGVKGVVIISAGFKETGREGEKMTEKIVKTARQYEMRVIGPNCLGFMRPGKHLNASFANKMALPGKIAFITQSGALGTAILDWSIKNNVGFCYFVSIGEMADISFPDLIDYFGADEGVESILIYMESLSEARKFMSAARAFARSKPIIILKVGRTEAGAKAAKSHTGSLTGNDAIFDAAFERAGIIRAHTVVELFHTAKALAMQPRPQGNRMAVITNAGGPGVIATDALVYSGGTMAQLRESTIAKLNEILPLPWSHGNPVDILGDADPIRYQKALRIMSRDKQVDAILVILTPQAMTDPTAVAKELIKLQPSIDKTILTTWMGGHDVAQGREILEQGSIPAFRQPEDAIRSFMHLCHYTEKLKTLYETPATIPHAFEPRTPANRKLIEQVLREDRATFNEAEAMELLTNYDIPVVKSVVAKTATDVPRLAKKIGFPVVMKILSKDIIHKTEVGGVRLNINSEAEAKQAFKDIMQVTKKNAPKAKIEGVFIAKQVKKRYELLIGSKQDAIFGPAIVFGLGGVAVEIFKDTRVGLPPLNMALAKRLIESTKVYKLLKGYRNMPGVDIQAIQFLLYKFAYLVADFSEIKELDINPFGVDEKGGVVLDAKVVLDKQILKKDIKPYSHLVISPYPKEYTYRFTLAKGQSVKIRPIRPEDEPLLHQLFTTFSRSTEEHRFFKRIKTINHELLTRYTQIDYDREVSLVAEVGTKAGKKLIGLARLVIESGQKAGEFAVVVGDPWHFQKLGNKFTDLILKIAKERGVKKVYAKYLKNNQPMEAIFKKHRFKITNFDKKTKYAELLTT